MPETMPVLFDTDIGSDIDDAVALAYLLRKPECELVGITTVTGDVAKRAALAQVLCEAAGRPEIPIHCGAANVLLYGPGQPDVPQYEAIASLPHRHDWPPGTAIEFMLRAIRERPGEVALLSVGPLTNVALLFAIDPEIPSLLRSWVSMAGSFGGEYPKSSDWNDVCDPIAAAVAIRSAPKRRVHVGLDVTMKCRLGADEVRSRFKGPLLQTVLQMAGPWFEHRNHITFHDPLAAAVVFEPALCTYERGRVTVDLSGHTTFEPDPGGREEVALKVDSTAFFEEYFKVVGG
jgi:purine nucleosidase